MRRRLPPLRGLEAFAVAAGTRSVTAAARRLHLTESAVSRQIRSVESYLGQPLLLRHPGGLRLTSTGRRFLPIVEAALDGLESAAEAIRTGPQAAVLRIACDLSVASLWLLPRLAQSPRAEHVTDLEFVDLDYLDSRPHLVIAWRDGPLPDAATDLLREDAFGPVRSPTAGGRRRPGTAAAERVPRLHVRTWPDAWVRWQALAGGGGGSSAVVETEMPHLLLALQACRAGLGDVIAPRALVSGDLARGTLVAPSGFRALGRALVATVPVADPIHPPLARTRDRFRAWLEHPVEASP